MNPQNTNSLPVTLYCNYSSEYQSMYEPSYQMTFIFIDEEEFDISDELSIDDLHPLPSTGFGRA